MTEQTSARRIRFGIEIPHRASWSGARDPRGGARVRLRLDRRPRGDPRPTLDSGRASYIAALTTACESVPACTFWLSVTRRSPRSWSPRSTCCRVAASSSGSGSAGSSRRSSRRPACSPGARGARRRGDRRLPGAVGAVAGLVRGPVHAVRRRRARAEARPARRAADLDRRTVGLRATACRPGRRRLGRVPRTPERFRASLGKIHELRPGGGRPLDSGQKLRSRPRPLHGRRRGPASRRGRPPRTISSASTGSPSTTSPGSTACSGLPRPAWSSLPSSWPPACGTFIVYFTVPGERVPEQLERFGTEVLPRVAGGQAERAAARGTRTDRGRARRAGPRPRGRRRDLHALRRPHAADLRRLPPPRASASIDVRHEQAAAHAADAWARLTRGLGVAVVVPGPGVTDAVTGVANAHAARSPLLLIGGGSRSG